MSKSGGLKHLIEEKLETPVFLVMLPFMVATAAEVFSGGVFDLPHLLGPAFAVWQIVRGLGLGFGSETLTVIAGRSWRAWLREAVDVKTRSGLSKVQRTTHVADAEAHAKRSLVFMCIGAGSSIFAGLSYYISNGSHMTVWAIINDVVATGIITAVVLYIGVFRDRKADDDTEEMVNSVQSGLSSAVDAATTRFRQGIATDTDIALIAEVLPPNLQTKFRRAVAKEVAGEVWSSGKLRMALGYGNDATKTRKLNDEIRRLERSHVPGVRKGPDGKTWQIPRSVVMDTWGEEIAEVKVRARLLNGHSSTVISGVPAPSPDVHRSLSGDVPDVQAMAAS